MGDVNIDDTINAMDRYPEDFDSEYLETVKRLRRENKPLTVIGFPTIRKQAIDSGDYPLPYGSEGVDPNAHLSIFRPIYRNGEMRYNVTAHNVDMAYRVDATDVIQLSEAVSKMRGMAVQLAEYYRKYVPGFGRSYLLQVAEQAGIRESRRIMGDYILSGEEALAGERFDDTVGYCGATVDVHDEGGGKEKTDMRPIKKGGAYQVPYRILLPLGLECLLTAGRCVSVDRIACGSIRQQAGCLVTGQAAGTAAALSVKKNIRPRDLKVEDLQEQLRSDGVIL